MAICMSVAAGHIHGWCSPPQANGDHCAVECDQVAVLKHGGRATTQIGLRIPDEDAVKLREVASRYESLNDYLVYLIRTQAIRER